MYATRNNDFAIVLAGGRGSRLGVLTTLACGETVPKQYCSLDGGASLLEQTVERAARVVPRAQISAVVDRSHRRWWLASRCALGADALVVQPANRGTAWGILLPLLHVFEREPDARVLLLPSDHYVRDELVLGESLAGALARCVHHPHEIVLLGIGPDAPDPELGYVVPGAALAPRLGTVARFVEKPPLAEARALLQQGAVWNSFIMAGSVRALLSLCARRLGEDVHRMAAALRGERDGEPGESLDRLYANLAERDFSRDVLQHEEPALRVLSVPACGWSDLGTPHRVAACLRTMPRRGERRTVPGALLDLSLQHARMQLAS